MEEGKGSLYLITVFAIIIALLLVGTIICLVFINQKRRNLAIALNDAKDNHEKMLREARIEIQDQTMKEIAGELHDDLATMASLINIHLVIIQPENIRETEKQVKTIQELNMYILNKIRSYSHLLNSDLMRQIGFEKAIRTILDRLSNIKTCKFEVNVSGDEFRLDPDTETIIFRICQEVLNNILKHSQAKKIVVDLNYEDDELQIAIEDDGVGFDSGVSIGKNQPGMGWLNIHNRAKMINAYVDIQSEKDKGTKVQINIPILNTV